METEQWDYCVRAEGQHEEAARIAAALGWSGMCMLSEKAVTSGGDAKEAMPRMMHGAIVSPKKPGDVARLAREKKAPGAILAVIGTSDEVNRAAAETPGVTMLLPGGGTKVDVVMARLARDNGVRIAFEFSPLLHAAPGERGKVFSQMALNARSVRKLSAPFVLSSGALSPYGLRSPSELCSLGRLLGFSDPQIRESMGPGLAKETAKRLSGKWVMPGVEVEE